MPPYVRPASLAGKAMPLTTPDLDPAIRAYCQQLQKTPAKALSLRHLTAAQQVSGWISERKRAGLMANVIVVCTGNSRRSCLGSILGNIAAAFYDVTGVRFYSGGTSPTAFNPRTIQTLHQIGVEIEHHGELAPSGPGGEPNPRYSVRWGTGETNSVVEFSKRYDDIFNPQDDFCAIMVCTDADEHCPLVAGAKLRVSMPIDDPQEFDGLPSERTMYSVRRDQIGQAMLLMLRPAEPWFSEVTPQI